MRVERSLLLGAVCLTAAGCCPSFAVAMAEFDSVAGWRPAQPEPEQVSYASEAQRMPFAVRQLEGSGLDGLFAGLFGIEPSGYPLDKPADFVRDRIDCFVADAVGNIHNTALAMVRLVWVMDGDPHAFNQLHALQGVAKLATWLETKPLSEELVSAGDLAEEAVVSQWQPYVAALRAAVDRVAADRPLEDNVRAAALQATRTGSNLWPPLPRDRRVQVLLLSFLSRRCADRDLRVAADAELRLALRRTAADTLRRALFEPRSSAVRELAVRVCYRLEGDGAVAKILRFVAAPGGSTTDRQSRVALDPQFRLSLVRLCGQLPEALAVQAEPGAAAPVEFLYDTIADATSSRALQIAALEALARCLGKPVLLERAWADAWWVDYVARKGSRA